MSNDKNTLVELVREVPAEYRGQLRAYVESSPAAQPAKPRSKPQFRAGALIDLRIATVCRFATRDHALESRRRMRLLVRRPLVIKALRQNDLERAHPSDPTLP